MSLLERLERLDACALSDAGDALGIVVFEPSLARFAGPSRLVGRCVTVLLGPPADQVATSHLCTGAIEASGPGDVIVVAHQGRSDCAGWGGNLSRAAQVRGIRGTVIHGAARDIDEADEIGYPVFATAATAVTARGRTQEHSWGQPVQLDRVRVSPGDWVVADRSGVVFIPAERAEELVARAELITEREAAMARDITTGTPVGQVMGTNYETMLEETP